MADEDNDILYIDAAVAVYVERIEIDVVHCLPDRGADCDDDILYGDPAVAVSVAEKSHIIGGNLPLRRAVREQLSAESAFVIFNVTVPGALISRFANAGGYR